MSIVVIVFYCLIAGCLIFGLTFHDELIDETQRQRKLARSLTVIQGGKRIMTRPRRHV